jgi:hypothetical protein
MYVLQNSLQTQIFNGMTLFYNFFTNNITMIMVPITKVIRKIESFLWTSEY